MGCLTWAKCM